MPDSLRVLLVDDQPNDLLWFQNLCEELAGGLAAPLDITPVRDYDEGLRLARLGVFPLVVADLDMPDPAGTAGRPAERYRGHHVLDEALAASSHAVMAAFTVYAGEAVHEIVNSRPHALLDKNSDDRELKEQIQALVAQAADALGSAADVCGADALDEAFGNHDDPDGQWEYCLRQVFRAGSGRVTYNALGGGKSGAGVLAAYPEDETPIVLKLGAFVSLQDEVRRYETHVARRMDYAASVASAGLVHAGNIGVLPYTLKGGDGPNTLGDVLDAHSAKEIGDRVERHFKEHCALWSRSYPTAAPQDVAERYRQYYKLNGNDFLSVGNSGAGLAAVRLAASKAEVAPTAMLEAIARTIDSSKKCRCWPNCRAHGDLNCRNLVWGREDLWLIDFAKTDLCPRLVDYVKLEASLKYDIPGQASLNERLVFEDNLVAAGYQPIPGVANGDLRRRGDVISVIRACARDTSAYDFDTEYPLALLMVTVKHAVYLIDAAPVNERLHEVAAQALYSAYRLATTL